MIRPAGNQNFVVMIERLPLWLPIVLIIVGVLGCLFLVDSFTSNQHQVLPTSQAEQLQAADPSHGLTSISPVPVEISRPVSEYKPVVSQVPPKQMPLEATNCSAINFLVFKRGRVRPNADKLNEKIALLKDWLIQHPEFKLVLEGYSDQLGTKQVNLLYSYRRAKLARDLLVKAGVAEDRLIVDAHISANDVADSAAEAEAKRRVTVKSDTVNECISHLFDGVNN